MSPPWQNVAIVGVGLLGGSLGLALRERKLAATVTGIGRDAQRLRMAVERGVISKYSTDLMSGVADADLVVLCTPVSLIASQLGDVYQATQDDCLITDVGSTKAQIVSAADALDTTRFVGSHPLAGSEQTGFEHARADLFENRLVIVTPSNRPSQLDDQATAVNRIRSFWESVGAHVQQMPADQHDRLLATTSHLPHLIAAALSAMLKPDEFPLTGTGWRDTTRIAAGDAELWRQIIAANREAVVVAMQRFGQQWQQLQAAIENDNPMALMSILEQGKQNRESLGS